MVLTAVYTRSAMTSFLKHPHDEQNAVPDACGIKSMSFIELSGQIAVAADRPLNDLREKREKQGKFRYVFVGSAFSSVYVKIYPADWNV